MKKQFILTLIAGVLFTGAFAQGYYMEFKISSTAKEAGMSGTMKSYYQDGNSRGEINMMIPQFGEMNVVTIIQKDSPGKVFTVDEKNKSYTEIEIGKDEDWQDHPQADYEVTVIGKETVNGYNATHVKLVRKGSKTPQEYWMSKDVADYANMAKMKTKFTGKDNMMKAFEEKGAEGFPVRIKTTEQGNSIQVDLLKAEKRSNPSKLYSLDGYDKSSMGSVIPAGIDVQQMMKDVQSMTPEEREAWIKQMQQQYQPK